jgi:hypothetical protein
MTTDIVKRSNEMVAPPASLIEASLKLPERDLVKVSETLIAMATCSPEVARGAIYCVPVGKDKETGLQKFKMGESVRLAEMAQGAFGRMFCDLRIEEQTAQSVTVKAMLMDLQTLNIYTGLGVARIFNADRAKLAIGAATSIAKRNAILSMVRPYTNAILPQIKATIVRSLSDEGSVKEALDKLLAEFAELGVPAEKVKEAVKSERDNVDRVVVLIGILNALRDNTVTLEDVFGGEPPAAGTAPKKSGSRLGDRLAGKPDPQPKTEAEPGDEADRQMESERTTKIAALKAWRKARKDAWSAALVSLDMAPIPDDEIDALTLDAATALAEAMRAQQG